MVVTGSCGTGKSTLCQRLAGTISGLVALDSDLFSQDVASVISPRHDYPSFWRFLMQLAHAIAQNGLAIAYFGVMAPEQVLSNHEAVSLFSSVHFLGLVCDEDVLQHRVKGRDRPTDAHKIFEVYPQINAALRDQRNRTPNLTTLDASRPIDDVEADVRQWVHSVMGTPMSPAG